MRKSFLFYFGFILYAASSCKKDDQGVVNNISNEISQGKGGNTNSKIGAPTNLKGEVAVLSSINLYWKDNSSNESGFIVERKTNKNNYTPLIILPANSTSYQDNDLTEGLTYTYRIKVYNNTETAYSNVVNITNIPDITSNLVAFYPFNGNVNDESGNGLNLTTFGSPVSVPDRSGISNAALDFNGTTDYLYHDRAEAFLLGDNFTLNAWIYSDSIDNDEDVILGTLDFPNYASAGGYQLTLEKVSQGLRLNLRNQYSYIDFGYSLGQTFFGKWVMVTGVFTPTVQNIYINGNLVQTQNSSYYLVEYGGLNNFRIGANPHSLDAARLFKGRIDDVRVYKRVLNQEQITYLATH